MNGERLQDREYMAQALVEAEKALAAGEMPVGALVVKDGRVLGRAHNLREALADPTAHAEILALRQAAQLVGNWRLQGCSLYVTLEPCPMCAGAILQARLERVVFGAFDPAAGCAGSVYRITEDPAFNHFSPAVGGVLEAPCQAILDRFFQDKRSKALNAIPPKAAGKMSRIEEREREEEKKYGFQV